MVAFLAMRCIISIVSIGILIYLYVCRRRNRRIILHHKRRIKEMKDKLEELKKDFTQQLEQLHVLANKITRQISMIDILMASDELDFDLLKNMITEFCDQAEA